MRPSIGLLAILSRVLAGLAQAQQPGQAVAAPSTDSSQSEISTKDSDTAIKVQVNLVLVPVVVNDSAGNAVSGLKKEDLQLLDNGKPQTVSTFSVETAETRAPGAAASAEKPADADTELATPGVPGPLVGKPLELPRRFVALVFDDLHMRVAEAMPIEARNNPPTRSLPSVQPV
jgi:hypothetical protein